MRQTLEKLEDRTDATLETACLLLVFLREALDTVLGNRRPKQDMRS